MQAAKDTFLNFLATRLQQLDATRTIVIDGVTRPAVLACENQRAEQSDAFENTFCVAWGEPKIAEANGVSTSVCVITYWTRGSASMSGVDRGRELTKMDSLLLEMTAEKKTPKLDLTADPAKEYGTNVFWRGVSFSDAEQLGMRLQRKAKLEVHYFPEEAQ